MYLQGCKLIIFTVQLFDHFNRGWWGGQDCTGTVRIITQAQVKSLNVKEICMIFPCHHDKLALDTDTQSSERREEGNVEALSDVGWVGGGGVGCLGRGNRVVVHKQDHDPAA